MSETRLENRVIQKKNFLTTTLYNRVIQEAIQLKGSMEKIAEADRQFSRVYLDNIYAGRRAESVILNMIQDRLFNEDLYYELRRLPDAAFQLIHMSTSHETQLTSYGNGQKYDWHRDVNLPRLLNYILYLGSGHSFSGGNLEISLDLDETADDLYADVIIEPTANMFVLMPSYFWHRVTPVTVDGDDILDGRISINGHIGWQ